MSAAFLDDRAFRGTLENTMDAVFITDFDGTILYCNRAAESMFGYSKEEVEGKKVEDVGVPERFREAHVPQRQKFAEHGVTARMHPPDPVPALRSDGTEFLVEAIISRDEERGFMRVSMRDVTARVKAQQEAAQAIQSKEDFLSLVSHELRNPLAVIRTSAYLLREGIGQASLSDQREHADRIEEKVQIIDDLINDLLAYSQSAKIEPTLSAFHVQKVVRSAVSDNSSLALRKGLSCNYTPGDESLTLKADERWTSHILANLLKNAVKYTEKGGITVSYGEDTSRDRVWVRFEDTGIGIPADKLEIIFDQFFQVDRNQLSSRGGAGLGLYIARKLARDMGGDVTVESKVGVGSIFTLALPKTAESAE